MSRPKNAKGGRAAGPLGSNPLGTAEGVEPIWRAADASPNSAPLDRVLEDSLKTSQRQATYDALRPLSVGLAILWALFIPFNVVDLPRETRTPVLLHDFVMVAASLGLYFLIRKDRVPIRWAGPVMMAMACVLASNVLLTFWLTERDFLSFYIGIILIASGNLILTTRWFAGAGILILCAWAFVVSQHVSGGQLAHLVFLQVASILVAVTIHFTRLRFIGRIFELRQRDKEREEALQGVLSETELARRQLDQRVADRTRELQSAYDDLTSQLEESVRLEEERRVLEAELHHAQRLESVGQLAGGIAHDFNNLLTVISGNMDMVLDAHDRIDETHRVCLEDARAATGRAAKLTTELLAYSRKQPIVLEAIDPVETIQGMRSMIERAATENIELEVVLNPIERSIHVGQGQIEQVVMNLVLNACDAMRMGGNLRIELDQVDACPASGPQGAERSGPFIRLRVMDNGCGMDDETQGKVFEPYFTTKEKGKGTGLGLSVVHGIVNQHQGHLALESTPSAGSTFSVYLPSIARGEPRQSLEAASPLDDAVVTETILVAEDEVAVGRLSKMLLEKIGYRVLLAESGAQALELARQYEAEIHLLLTDVVMPGMLGPELAERLRRVRPATRVLFVSGYTDPEILPDLNLREGVAFLQKPFTLNSLRLKIRELLVSELAPSGDASFAEEK
jgi:signal transduction histidine kinase/CheY-like chemotaxis protein